MKKWLIVGASLLVLFLVACQVLIPKNMVVSRSITTNANLNALVRFLSTDTNWKKWWPNDESNKKATDILSLGGRQFSKSEAGYHSFGISIHMDGQVEKSLLNLFSVGYDSLKIIWSATLHSANNPISKIELFLRARQISNSFKTVLEALNSYASKVKNLYGFDIRRDKIQMEFLVSIRKTISRYPTTNDIYDMIRSIERHIATKPVKTEHLPIMHIEAKDSVNYDVLVAVPIDREIPDSGIFITKKILRNGNILVVEMTGGNYTVQQALKQIDTYASDHRLTNVAIPYQSFMVDRTVVTDSTKWRTLIAYPII